MATKKVYGLMAGAASCYLLGLVLTVCGYAIPWLLPRETYYSTVVSVGLIKSCFSQFKFPGYVDRDQTVFDGCYQLTDAKFDYIRDYVRPDWLIQIRTMHFVCILIMAFVFLIMGGFLLAYCMVQRQTARKGRPWNSMVMAKAGCALWFIPVGIVAILQIVEPSMFYYNLERNRMTFYTGGTSRVPLNYAGGFVISIVTAVVCIACTVLGIIIFVGIIQKTTMLMGENFVAKRLEAASRSSMVISVSSSAYDKSPATGNVDVTKLDPSDEIIEKLSFDPEDRWSRHSRSDAGSYRSGGSASDAVDASPAGNGRPAVVSSSLVGGRPAPAPRRSSQGGGRKASTDSDSRRRDDGRQERGRSGRSASPHSRARDASIGGGGGGSTYSGNPRRSTSTSPSRREGSDRGGRSQTASSAGDRRMMAAVATRARGTSPARSGGGGGAYTPKSFTPVAKNPVYNAPEPQIAKNKMSTYVSY